MSKLECVVKLIGRIAVQINPYIKQKFIFNKIRGCVALHITVTSVPSIFE